MAADSGRRSRPWLRERAGPTSAAKWEGSPRRGVSGRSLPAQDEKNVRPEGTVVSGASRRLAPKDFRAGAEKARTQKTPLRQEKASVHGSSSVDKRQKSRHKRAEKQESALCEQKSPYIRARERLTRMTPPTIRTVARSFCQVRWSSPIQMLTAVAKTGCR